MSADILPYMKSALLANAAIFVATGPRPTDTALSCVLPAFLRPSDRGAA